jgi:hypothetical protein
LGLLPRSLPLAPGSVVDVAVRPDDVRLTAHPEGRSRVLDRQFLGIAFIVRVRLPDGTIVHSWQSHPVDLPVGTAVQATIRPGHMLPCFQNGTAI